ncbi:tetratricopeptide repeat protein [Streptomyces microflavus]|uniref:tetratricopeptide repeat protein n=1 Tax=Streptomyces microflavus TaxID=1919 RepID=UPI0033F29035
MGHKSIEETYRTYRHLMPGSMTRAARILDTGLPLGFRHNLANSYWPAGRIDGALAIEEQLLTDCERVPGARHPPNDAVRSAVAVIRGREAPPGGEDPQAA